MYVLNLEIITINKEDIMLTQTLHKSITLALI